MAFFLPSQCNNVHYNLCLTYARLSSWPSFTPRRSKHLFRLCHRSAGARRRVRRVLFGRVAVPLPPVQAADELAHPEAEAGHLGGGVAADAVAVADVEGLAVEVGRGRLAYGPVGQAHRAGDVLGLVGGRAACVDDHDVFAVPEGLAEVPRFDFVGELVFIVSDVFLHGGFFALGV